MLLAKFWHARYLTNEILWNVEQKWHYTRLRREKQNKKTIVFVPHNRDKNSDYILSRYLHNVIM